MSDSETSTANPPQFIYRLATKQEWFVAEETGVVPTRDIDKRDGYLHLSTKEQVLETARLHFRGVEDLLALEIPFDGIATLVKFEIAPKRGEAFPHLYGALRHEHVARAIKMVPESDAFTFGDAL